MYLGTREPCALIEPTTPNVDQELGAMNWTGGTLQRTKYANKGVMQRQRAYFARARTKLQQSPSTQSTPFRPEYYHNSDGRDVGDQSAEDSARFPRDSTGMRHSDDAHYPSPRGRRKQWTKKERKVHKTEPRLSTTGHKEETGKVVQRKKRRKDKDDDNEMQLLTANKKRYLGQQDCIDVAANAPVAQDSLSVKEKSRFGKHRKIRRAVVSQRSPVTFARRSGPEDLEGHSDTFMSGALPVLSAADTIRVRIGSDVVTTLASVQHSHVPSLISSDSMLFEQEENNAAQQKQPLVTFGVQSECREIIRKPQYIGSQPARSDRNYSPERDRSASHNIATRLDSSARELVQSEADDPRAQSIKPSEATDPSYRLTRHVGGVEHPLKFVFGRSTSPLIRHARLPNNAGETQRVHAPFDATEDKSGHAPRNVGEDHHPAVRRHPDASVINAEEPWAMYLDSDISSSGQVCVGNGTGMSVPQPYIPARNTNDACTNWPRHNTPDSLTHVNLTKVSASLPAYRLQCGRPVAIARPSLRTAAVKGINKDEALWQTFAAVGSDSQPAIETVHSHEMSENSTSRATKGYASTRLPTAAVTSVSSTPFPSTPFRSLSGQASRVSDDVQYAPCSASRSIPSAVPSSPVWGRIRSPGGEVEDVPVGAQGDETSPGRLGEHSDRASLQNHASNDSEVYSDTRTPYRDLNSRISSAWDDVSRRAQASGSIVWQRGWPSSIRDNDDTGIDLVYVDGLT